MRQPEPARTGPSTAVHGKALCPWRQFFVAGLALLLVACGVGAGGSADTSTTVPQLYVMARSGTGWTLALADLHTGQLTPLLEDIGGFAPGKGAFAVVLDGGHSLALWDERGSRPLWACTGLCHEPVLSPAGDFLAWIEELEGRREGWVLPLAGGEARSLGPVEGRPVWSPLGERLAFAAPAGLTLWDVVTQRTEILELRALAQPAWSPDGARLAMILLPGTPVLYDVQLGLPQPLTPDAGLSLATELAWSPTGTQLAVLMRRFSPPEDEHDAEDPDGVHTERFGADALGAQPWLFSLAEGSFKPLPGDGGAGFARPVWSADGRWLAAARLPMGAPDPQPEVWVWESETGRLIQRFPGTAAPAWAMTGREP